MKTVPQPVVSASLDEMPPEDLLAALLAPGGPLPDARALGCRLLAASGGLPRLARMSARELLGELSGVLAAPRVAARDAPHDAARAASHAAPDDGVSGGVRAGSRTTGAAQRSGARGAERAALRLASAFELGRRAARVELAAGQAVRGMADLEPHLRGLLDGRLKELFLVVLLDAKNRPLRTERVSEGCLTWSVVHPREVYAPAVRESAGAVIVAHNHPSGDPTPSAQDIEVTARLAKVGELLGIPLLDHIVVGRQRCVSMRAQGLMGSLTVPA